MYIHKFILYVCSFVYIDARARDFISRVRVCMRAHARVSIREIVRTRVCARSFFSFVVIVRSLVRSFRACILVYDVH